MGNYSLRQIKMFNKQGLSPEKCRALAVLEDTLPGINQECFWQRTPSLNELCETNSIFILPRRISMIDLPRETKWLWNQSRARQELTDYTGTTELLFYKLNTRKSRSTREPHYTPPPIKLWIFNVKYSNEQSVVTVIWCERGISFPAPIISPQIEELSLHDLQFLRPFVTESVAISLGWQLPPNEAQISHPHPHHQHPHARTDSYSYFPRSLEEILFDQ